MNNSSTICVDANIIIRLTLKLDDEIIKQLWTTWMSQDFQLVAPTLLYYEVANGLYKQEKSGRISSELVRNTLDFALTLPIQLVGDAALHQRAHTLAAQYSLAATYDAHYLALAERLDIDLWTTDAKLFNAVRSAGMEWVKLVEK
jgi:predicted nucleic acid-binding protein